MNPNKHDRKLLADFFEMMSENEKKIRDMANEFEIFDYQGPEEHSPGMYFDTDVLGNNFSDADPGL